MKRAFDALEEADLAFGPAADGGYYLVGLSRPCNAIFTGIAWGGAHVLAQSLATAKQAGCHAAQLGVLNDVDIAEDLPAAEAALRLGTSLSLIIPEVKNEHQMKVMMDRLKSSAAHQILVTENNAAAMNQAAITATGEFLLFLNLESWPMPDPVQLVTQVMESPTASAGVLRIDSHGNLRPGRLDVTSARDGLLLRRQIFQHLGGFPD